MKKSRLAAAGAAIALGLSGVFIAAVPSIAADYYYDASDIGVEGGSYPAGWFTGIDPAAAAAPVDSEDGLVITGRTILLNGDREDDVADGRLAELVESAAVDADGDWHFQIPVFLDGDTTFATLRPAVGNSVTTADQWISSRAIGTVPANTAVSFEEIAAAFESGSAPTILAYGILVSEGQTTTVASITWGADTSYFTAEPASIDDTDVPGTTPAAPATPVADHAKYAG